MDQVSVMPVSAECFDMVKHFEGFRAVAYRDPVGILTIGYGHTRGVRPGDRVTDAQAVAMLRDDLAEAANAVRAAVTVPLTVGQFEALRSFTFNVGPGAKGKKDGFVRLASGKPSTMLRKMNTGDYEGAGREFERWVYGAVNSQKRILPGLVSRRAAEAALWRGEDWRVAAGLSASSPTPGGADMKPLTQSRTVRGGVAGTAIAGAAAAAAEVADLAGVAGEAGQQVQTVVGLLPPGWLPWVVAAVLAVTVGYMLYRRIDDHRQSQG